MNETVTEMHKLLEEVSENLRSMTKPAMTAAVTKLERIAALSSTLAFTIQAARR